MGRKTLHRLSFAGALALAAAAVAGPSCSGGPRFSSQAVLTATVTLGDERTLILDAPLPLEVTGRPRLDTVQIDVDATVTASSATVAKQLAEALELVIERPSPRVLRVTLPGLTDATLAGKMTVAFPADMDLEVLGRGGPVDVFDPGGDITVSAVTHVRVVGAGGSAVIRVEGGNALIDSAVAPGTTTDIAVGRGDIELTVPFALSADIEAQAGAEGVIAVAHPDLPRWPGGGLPYRALSRGGLARVLLSTRAGSVVIRAR